eukprot:m.82376 g.82376  ORF g.82376 m.82376 type:complete len:459 (+) comp9461_c0_seq1:223-1599(+)
MSRRATKTPIAGPASVPVTTTTRATAPHVDDPLMGAVRSIGQTLLQVAVWVASSLISTLTTILILPTVRWYLDNFAIVYRRIWYWSRATVCIDGYCPTDGVTIDLGVIYGEGPYEDVDVVVPRPLVGGGEGMPVAVYLHGGGFVACTSQCLLHSVAIPLARNGHLVYSINYPLAPENSFPDPVIAALRAMAYIKAQTGTSSVVLIGDSAGGAVASTVTAVLTAEGMYEKLVSDVASMRGGPGWRVLPPKSDLPTISKLVSIYGVMDWEGWSDEPDPVTGEVQQMQWNDHIGAAVLRFCLRCYAPSRHALGGRCLLADFSDEELSQFPPTLLLCGSWDPLVHGNRDMNKRLKSLGRTVTLVEYPAHHAFLGFPVAWNFIRWVNDSWPAYHALTRFVLERDPAMPTGWPAPQWLDPTLPFAMIVAIGLLPLVFTIVMVGKLHALGPIKSMRASTLHDESS